MSRLLGFLIGLLAAMAAVAVIVTSVPSRAPAPASGLDEGAPSARVPEPLPDAAGPVATAAADPRRESADAQGEIVEAAEQRPVTPDDKPLPDGPRTEEPMAEPQLASAASIPAAPDGTVDTPRWHAFWQPFHSRISAEGFLVRLERVTGLDYRIVSPQPGEYQVAFAYRDEAERQAHLAAIEAATGLVLRNTVL